MAREHLFRALTVWSGAACGPTSDYASYSREYTFAMEGKPTLTLSAAGAYRGDESLPNPEELLLASVSGCHMLSYLALCAMAKIPVTSYEDACVATMTFKDGKMRIVEAVLSPTVTYGEGVDVEAAQALHHRAHEECFIANSVNFPIVVELPH